MAKLKKDGTKKNSGRPPRFKTEQEFKDAVFGYLKICEEKGKMPNIAGFCAFNGIDRTVYYDYAKKYPRTKKGFEAFLEDVWVQRLSSTSPTGAIFYLKNAFREDYKDRTETDITSGGKPIPILNGLHRNRGHKKDTILNQKD